MKTSITLYFQSIFCSFFPNMDWGFWTHLFLLSHFILFSYVWFLPCESSSPLFGSSFSSQFHFPDSCLFLLLKLHIFSFTTCSIYSFYLKTMKNLNFRSMISQLTVDDSYPQMHSWNEYTRAFMKPGTIL